MALLVLILSAPTWGTTYYVSAESGDNANSGTSAGDPWKSLTYALTNSASSDKIVAYDGEYNSTNGELFPLVVLGQHLTGESSSNTTIESWGTGSGGVVRLFSNSTLESFTIKSHNAQPTNYIVVVPTATVEGVDVMYNRIFASGLNADNAVGILFSGAPTGFIFRNIISGCDQGVAINSNSTVTVEGNTIAKCRRGCWASFS
ncbi:DUF1565 domain-containing protein, partial [Candidatus Margulisiibacteriota bacterium]